MRRRTLQEKLRDRVLSAAANTRSHGSAEGIMSRSEKLCGRIRLPIAESYREALFAEREIPWPVDSSLDFGLTTGRFAEQCARECARLMEPCEAILVNSGPSAKLLAISRLTSEHLGDRRVRPGHKVITISAGFRAIFNPMVQNGLVPDTPRQGSLACAATRSV